METLTSNRMRWALLALVWSVTTATAHADVSTSGLTNDVIQTFETSVHQWQQPIQQAALHLFWLLSVISLAVGLALLAAGGHFELGSIVVEVIRWILFTGFWSWVLTNAPQFFMVIVRSLWQLGGSAGGATNGLSVSGIMNVALQIYRMDAGGLTDVVHPGQSLAACLAGVVVLILGVIMAANVLLIMCGGWIVAYAGAIVAGMTSRWTLDLGVGYMRAALAYGLRAMTAQLVIGLGLDLLNRIIHQVGNPPNLSEVAYLALALGILAALGTVLPWQVGHLAGGGGGFGGVLGFGAAWMAARIASQVVSQLRGQGEASGSKGGAQKSSVEKAAEHGEALIARGVGSKRHAQGNGNGNGSGGGQRS